MGLIFTIYEVGRISLHGEIKAVRFTGLDGDVGGGFIEIASWLKRCVLVNGNTDGVVVSGVSWCS